MSFYRTFMFAVKEKKRCRSVSDQTVRFERGAQRRKALMKRVDDNQPLVSIMT